MIDFQVTLRLRATPFWLRLVARWYMPRRELLRYLDRQLVPLADGFDGR